MLLARVHIPVRLRGFDWHRQCVAVNRHVTPKTEFTFYLAGLHVRS